MSIPTSVYENGRWVTRYQDVHHVLAQNRKPETIQAEKVSEIEKPPCYGLLSRTVVPAPVVKWIIPARIRHHEKNDVLYITANSVEIKEAHGDYTLHHIATKADFDAPIRAARICGLQRELTKPDVSAIIRDEHWRDDVQDSNPGLAIQPMDEDSDCLVKEEDLESLPDLEKLESNEADLLSMKDIPLHTRILSPHILVLTLDSGKLVFMYTISGDARNPHIVTSQRPLWRGHTPFLEQIGRHVAVDTRSRAVAVAAQERYFYLYKLKPMEELQKEVRKFPRLEPIASEQPFEVDGTILRMEFLHPHPRDQGIVTLLLIVCNRGKSRLFWYEWDVSRPLNLPNVKQHKQVLPNDDRMPLLLIPMTKLTAFLLVCENRLTLYTDLFTGTPSRHIHNLSHLPEPEENGTSRRQPVWVQWARAMRSWTHRAQEDGVYLCREDGIVHFLTLKYERPSLIDSNHQAGRLGTNIDTSFAVLDVGPHSSDVLAVGGDGSEGGLWQFHARAHAKKITGGPNWTPVIDMCGADWEGPLRDSSGIPSQNESLICCVGKSKYGAISEIRYGIPASRFLAISIKDILDSGVLDTWAFRSSQQATSYVFLSHPKQTYLVRIRLDDEDEDGGLVDIIEDSQALGLKERTLTIRSTSKGRLIQVTEKALWSTSLATIDEILDENDSEYRLHYTFGTAQVLACCLEPHGSQVIALVATKDRGKFILHLAQVNDSYDLIGLLEVADEPTAVALRVLGADALVFVGNSSGHFQVFKTKNFTDKNDSSVVSEFPSSFSSSACESITVSPPVEQLDGGIVMLIACGLRNGVLSVFEFKIQGNSIPQVKLYDRIEVGNTPVKVFVITSNPIRFVAQCQGQTLGQTLSVECCYSKGFPDGMRIHRICMTEDRDPEWQQDKFSAIAVVDDPEAPPGKSGVVELVFVDRNYAHVAALDYACGARNVHRRVGIGGSPVRGVYSKRLHKVIVLSNRVEITRPPRTVSGRTQKGKRTIRPVISFIDPQNPSAGDFNEEDPMDIDLEEVPEDALPNNQHRMAGQDVCNTLSYEPGERFLGITEWFPKIDTKEFHMLAVNTIIRARNNKSMTGRLLLFNVQVLGDHVTLVLKKESAHHAPIYAVAAYPDTNSLVFQCGQDIYRLNLEANERGPKTTASVIAHMRSPARHITIQKPFIYISTAGDSLAGFRDNPNQTEYLFGDSVARQCLHHINVLSNGRLILTVDMGGSLTGFWQSRLSSRVDNRLHTLFEACLPQSIVRLRAMELPLWLKDRDEKFDPLDPSKFLRGQCFFAGISVCGTISQHKLLAAHQWPMLRFLQNLAETSPIICPLREGSPTLHLDPDRINNPQTRAINGDILLRLLERGGGDLLRSLMNKPPSQSERFLDFDSVEERWARLEELFDGFSMTMPHKPSEEETADERKRYLTSNIVKALRRMLQPAL